MSMANIKVGESTCSTGAPRLLRQIWGPLSWILGPLYHNPYARDLPNPARAVFSITFPQLIFVQSSASTPLQIRVA